MTPLVAHVHGELRTCSCRWDRGEGKEECIRIDTFAGHINCGSRVGWHVPVGFTVARVVRVQQVGKGWVWMGVLGWVLHCIGACMHVRQRDCPRHVGLAGVERGRCMGASARCAAVSPFRSLSRR